jgi:enterobactin synthetase component F
MSDMTSDAPTDAGLESAVLTIWREVLGVEDAGPDDGFFDLGGDSIVATRLVARIRDELGRSVSLLTVFENPTAAELTAELLEQEMTAGR